MTTTAIVAAPTGNSDCGGIHIALAIGIGIGIAAFMLMATAVTGIEASTRADLTSCADPITSTKEADNAIPPLYLTLYKKAGQQYGIPWQVLASIGKAESDHGRDPSPGIHSGANSSGAMGPMQLLASEWATYGIDGNSDGTKSVYDPGDAIPAAARKLRHDGAPQHIEQAIFRYNPATWYVKRVLAYARAYSTGQDPTGASSPNCPDRPTQPPPNATAAKVIAYARAQIGKPYVYGAAGPDAFDCSGLTMKAYQAAGIDLPHYAADQWKYQPHVQAAQAQPGDLVFFISDGTRTDPGHVGIYIGAGKTIIAPHTGAAIRIESIHRSDFLGYARPAPRLTHAVASQPAGHLLDDLGIAVAFRSHLVASLSLLTGPCEVPQHRAQIWIILRQRRIRQPCLPGLCSSGLM